MRAQTISLSGRRKKKLQRQVEKYLNALKTHRNDYKIHIDLGDAYAELEDIAKGVKSYYGAIELLRQAPNISKTRNQIIELYEKIVEMTPDEYRAYIELSEEYIAAGQKEKAFRFLLTSAKKAYEEENYELALQCYNQAIAKGRTNPHIVERCTELYIKLGRKEEAMQNYVQIGDMYAQEEKNIEALEYYKKAVLLEPENPELLLKVARMYNAMAWTENAASELVKVGEHYEHNHEYTEALRYYNYSVRLDPENERAQEGRVRINQSPSVDGLVLADTADSTSGQAQPDILEQLDQIDGNVEEKPDFPVTGEFELTPLEATLTFEDNEIPTDVSGSDNDVEMEMIILDDEMEAESSKENPPGTDNALAFILDESQMINQPPPAEETLWFSPDADEPSGADAELLLPTQSADSIPGMHMPTNIFRLDDDESEIEGELTPPDILSAAHADESAETSARSEDLFILSDAEDSSESLLLEPGMLLETDTEETPEDLQPFVHPETIDLSDEAETFVMHEPRNLDFSEDISPFDEELPPFATEANALPPSAETSSTDMSSISLEDWIIDLKEDELVELALEEALREQEQEAAANWEELLGLEPSNEEEILHDGTPLSLPEQSLLSESAAQLHELGSAADIIDIRAETPAVSGEPDVGETAVFKEEDEVFKEEDEVFKEEDEVFKEEDEVFRHVEESGFVQEDIPEENRQEIVSDIEREEAPEHIQGQESTAENEPDVVSDTYWVEDASEEAPDMSLDAEVIDESAAETTEEHDGSEAIWLEDSSETTLDVYLDDDQSATFGDEEESEMTADEIVLEIDAADETLEDFVYNHNGAGTFLNQEEVPEEDGKIGVPLIDEALLTDDDDELDMIIESQAIPGAPDIEDTSFMEEMTSQAEPSEEPETIDEDEEIDFPIEVTMREDISQRQTISEERKETDDILRQSIEVAEMTQLLEESDIDEILAEHAPSEISGDIRDLRTRIEDLEQQLERTEEEKYFLQERFAAQISQHKAHEESLQREIAVVYRDKAELEKQLHVPSESLQAGVHVPAAKVTTGGDVTGFNNDRYNALIDKIEQKKTRIQQQLHKLLKKREENGRYLNQELDVLSNTKQRLQQNLEYIQQVKTHVEKKVNTELRQAKEEVQALTRTSKTLEAQLHVQRRKEQELHKEFAILRQEKEQLQQEYAHTLDGLQHAKTDLEHQLQQVSQAKYTAERTLKKKLQTLHRSYQQLKGEYKTVIELKDAQLAENAQKLHDVSSKYKELEKILAEIRKERTRLNTRLHEEVTARETLAEKLVSIETHVNSLDAQESKLMKQLEHELERHFTLEQHVSDKFHLSLDEFEGLLALQEKEIQTLEAI